MTYEEALTVTEFVVNCWPDGRYWTPEQIAAYAKGIQNLDAELATRAVERAQKTMDHRPKVNELISICRSLAVNAVVEPPASGKPSKMPLWIKEWICARYLYASFGRTQDAALWKAAVVDEELASRGMPRFSGHISAADAELIRAYVARQAALLIDQEHERTAPATQ